MDNHSNPFGAYLQRYWDKRYEYFRRFDDGILIDADGLHTVMPEQSALDQARLMPEAKTVVDGFCGVGGISIANARAGKQVIAIDNNAERIAMARHNACVYGVSDKITFIQGDFFNVAATVKADAVILDPPWGWPRQHHQGLFRLRHLRPDGHQLLSFAFSRFRFVILRIPTVFNIDEMNQFRVTYQVYDDISYGAVISRSILIESGCEVAINSDSIS